MLALIRGERPDNIVNKEIFLAARSNLVEMEPLGSASFHIEE